MIKRGTKLVFFIKWVTDKTESRLGVKLGDVGQSVTQLGNDGDYEFGHVLIVPFLAGYSKVTPWVRTSF